MGEVFEQDVDRLDARTLELLASQCGSMHSREVVDLLTDDDAEVLEAHPVDALVNGRDELDERDRSPVEDIERLGEHDQGDWIPFQRFSLFALAWRSRSVRWWTYRSQSATRTARWLSA